MDSHTMKHEFHVHSKKMTDISNPAILRWFFFVSLRKEGAGSVPLSLLYISLVLYACGV
jgi:hypothetical protein